MARGLDGYKEDLSAQAKICDRFNLPFAICHFSFVIELSRLNRTIQLGTRALRVPTSVGFFSHPKPD